jgi:hypothetical protein
MPAALVWHGTLSYPMTAVCNTAAMVPIKNRTARASQYETVHSPALHFRNFLPPILQLSAFCAHLSASLLPRTATYGEKVKLLHLSNEPFHFAIITFFG